MASPVLFSADGSDLSMAALEAGLKLLAQPVSAIIVTVADEPDPTLITGMGHAGPVMSPEEFADSQAASAAHAASVIEATQQRLGLDGCETRTLAGHPGAAICELADELSAAAIVIGSRGRSGIKRAVLGSVSDHVVRNATCPVIVTGAQED